MYVVTCCLLQMIRLLSLVVDHNQASVEKGNLCIVQLCVCVCSVIKRVRVCVCVCACMHACVCVCEIIMLSNTYMVDDDDDEEDESQLAVEEIQESLSIMTKAEKVVLKTGVVEKRGHSAAFLMWPKFVCMYIIQTCTGTCAQVQVLGVHMYILLVQGYSNLQAWVYLV